ncbi:C6 zinc finger domain protein [Moelleriella libera RCEF 2490]|uniref:C6 zinc finger domain protein n=1 Tax=Moelleriella libera RCEF 2490 TaxID=1081109 RepID=A0A167XU38_9HYPO|nr:C6 zinc finger domain protein [Moelleriella libera RCEF 2490]
MLLSARQPHHEPTPLCANASTRERQVFYDFRTRNLSLISGTMCGDFWTLDVLQTAQVYPAMWHAVLCISSTYSSLQMPTAASTRQKHFTLSQCNAAIRHISSSMASHEHLGLADKQVILLTSVLLVGFCSLQDDAKQASRIADHTLALCYKWNLFDLDSNTSSNAILSPAFVVGQMQRLLVQYLWLDNRVPCWLTRQASTVSISGKPFASLTEALLELQPLLAAFQVLMHIERAPFVLKLAEGASDPRARFVMAVAAWKGKFASMRVADGDGNDAELLQLWVCCVDLVLGHEIGQAEFGFDRLQPIHARMLSLAEQAMQGQADVTSRGTCRYFSFGLSLCEPLYVVARSCRDSLQRRRAIGLLRRLNRTEGLLKSAFLADVAEAWLHAEESDSRAWTLSEGHRVRPHACPHRIWGVSVTFLDGGLARVWLRSLEEVVLGQSGKTVVIKS